MFNRITYQIYRCTYDSKCWQFDSPNVGLSRISPLLIIGKIVRLTCTRIGNLWDLPKKIRHKCYWSMRFICLHKRMSTQLHTVILATVHTVILTVSSVPINVYIYKSNFTKDMVEIRASVKVKRQWTRVLLGKSIDSLNRTYTG